MGVLPRDLAFRLFGYSFGTWFWVVNSQSVDAAKLIRWSAEPGSHPFVLVADYDGGPSATVRPRSRSNKTGILHAAHPAAHSITCKIESEGWVLPMLWSLRPEAICAENYSCQEAYEQIVEKLRKGAAG